MPKIYKYTKTTDKFTTYALREPDYSLLQTEDRIIELCKIDGETYVAVPDSLVLPEQPPQITVVEVTLTTDLKKKIKKKSYVVQLINENVVAKIREQYSINDELEMLQTATGTEVDAYKAYVAKCRLWGRTEKRKLGL